MSARPSRYPQCTGTRRESTIDQKIVNGAASGTAAVRYVHPDHLGSTNVVTDQNQNLVQTLDFYPYGATRVSVSTSTNEKRKFIGQFSDDSGLSYLNARYYEGPRSQFLSQDPSFLAVGDPNKLKQVTGLDQQKFLSDPQLANSTSYGRDNPITNKDLEGKFINVVAGAVIGDFVGVGSLLYGDLSTRQTSSVSDYIAAGLGGAVNGAAFASGEGWLYGVGGSALGGAVQSTVSQGANYAKGTSDSFSVSQVVGTAASQAPFGLIRGPRVAGITAGRNNFEAIGKNVFTRYDNGYINSFSMSTAGKIFTGSMVRNAPQNFAQGYMSVPGNTQSLIAGLTSLVSSLQSLVQSLAATANKK